MDNFSVFLGFLKPGALYPSKIICQIFSDNIDSDEKKFIKMVKAELKKTVPRLIEKSLFRQKYYMLNPKINFEDERKNAEAVSITGMASVINKMVHSENERVLKKWLDDYLAHKLDGIVEDHVKNEFSDEILPVLLEKIDNKVAQSNKNIEAIVRKNIIDIFSTVVQFLSTEANG
jgi:hypothetical protein